MPEPAPVLASHSTAQKRSAKKQQRKARVRKPRTGVPAPLSFDITRVPRSHKLTTIEVAAAVRRSAQTVRLWALQPNHIIKFERIDGHWLTTVGLVLDYLNTPAQVSTSKRSK